MPRELQTECGVTRISLENLSLLGVFHGRVKFIFHYAPSGTMAEDATLVVYEDGHQHVATGFSCGYPGEGPHGLLEAIHKYLGRRDITIEHICGWREERAQGYMVLPGRGIGKAVLNLGACAFEVW